ncbi:polysaccharide deacetylase family protein [Aneurinibacillus tyrosinisolvens]|uniref:polysaccharide deacetylase family protein n=1 Tax=Aneurinibacillus tyrosinisolvens TaxID=1443435 RepID=UPI00069B5AA8|nr:polysaccharide deacetylase family protein [Aneurinibacillus tyrosinisolvens]
MHDKKSPYIYIRDSKKKRRDPAIKPAAIILIVFLLLFIPHYILQAAAYIDTLQQLEKMKEGNNELNKENTSLKNELDRAQKGLENLKQEMEKTKDVNKKVAYLTFDDGPSTNTGKILQILNNEHVKATFFVVGNNTDFGKEAYRQIIAGGHAIGNHTYSHNYRTLYGSVEAFQEDFMQLENLLYETIGQRPSILRFPGGSNNHVSRKYGGRQLMNRLADLKTKEGYQFFDWNVDSRDASKIVQNTDTIVQSVLNGSRNKKKAIILMHDSQVKTTTVQALPRIIAGLKKQGFSFDSLTKDSFTNQFIKQKPAH